MNLLNITSILGLKAVRVISAIVATSMLIGSSYVMWDMWHDEHSAFASYDMTQYRPSVENGEPATLEDIKKVNKDARAWLTIYNTHIDYPVMQGKDNLEYVNKNPNGETAPTGSIYLATENSGYFKDKYSIIYGHHVANGSMFGDISKFLKKSYFNGHLKGILITENQVYDLDIFASMETDAYDSVIYNTSTDLESLLKYIQANSKQYRHLKGITQVIAFSTCDDSRTNGRTLVFAKVSPHKGAYEEYEDIKPPMAMGHSEKYWAFLNLICMLVTIYLVLPIHIFKSKYMRRKLMEERNDLLEDYMEKNPQEVSKDASEKDSIEDAEEYDENQFEHKSNIGIIIEVIIGIISVIAFILTEDIRYPIQMIDRYTPLMLLILFVCLLADIYFERYRGQVVDGTNEEENDDNMNYEEG